MVGFHQEKSRGIEARTPTSSTETGSLNDIAGPRASQTRDQIRSSIQDKAKAPSQSAGITDTSIETSLSALSQQQEQFHKRVLTPAQSLVEGAKSNVETSRKEVAESGVVERLLGHRSALEAGLAIDERDVSNKTAHAEKLKARYDASLESKRAAEEMLATSKRIAEQGFTEEAAAMRVGASQLLNQASYSLKGLKAIDPQQVAETVAGVRELQKRLDGVIQRAEYAQTATAIVKETAHVAGVGVGFALGGPAGGAAVNQGLRMIEGAAEEGMHVVLGNKTREEAGSDFLKRSQDALVESAITGASGALGQRLGAFAGKLHGPVVAKTVDILSSGTIQSAGTGVQVGYEFAKAHQEFKQNNPTLAGPERERAYTEFMNAHGFALDEVCKRLGASFAAGAAAKGVFHAVAQANSLSQGVRVAVANGAENATSNVGEVTAQGGPITLETVVPALLGGHLVHAGVRQTQGSHHSAHELRAVHTPAPLAANATHEVNVNGVQGSIRVSGQGNAEYVSSRELLQERYTQQRSREILTTDSAKTPVEADTIARHESRGVVAYYDKENGRVVVPEFKGMPEAEKQKIVSFIHHEVLGHGRGGDEFAAYRVQADRANKLGLELHLEDGRVRLSKPEPGEAPRATSDAQIRDYIAKNYSKGQLESRVVAAGMEFGGSSELGGSNHEGVREGVERRRNRADAPRGELGPRAGLTREFGVSTASSELGKNRDIGNEVKSNARLDLRGDAARIERTDNERKSNRPPAMRADAVTRLESDVGVESQPIRAAERGVPPVPAQPAAARSVSQVVPPQPLPVPLAATSEFLKVIIKENARGNQVAVVQPKEGAGGVIVEALADGAYRMTVKPGNGSENAVRLDPAKIPKGGLSAVTDALVRDLGRVSSQVELMSLARRWQDARPEPSIAFGKELVSTESSKKLGGEVPIDVAADMRSRYAAAEWGVAELRKETTQTLDSLATRMKQVETALAEKEADGKAMGAIRTVIPQDKFEVFRKAVYTKPDREWRVDALNRIAQHPELVLGGGLLAKLGFGAEKRERLSAACREAVKVLNQSTMTSEDFGRQVTELKIEHAGISTKRGDLHLKIGEREAELAKSREELAAARRQSYFMNLPGGSEGAAFSVRHPFKRTMTANHLESKLKDALGRDGERVHVVTKIGGSSGTQALEVVIDGLRSEDGFEFARSVLTLAEAEGGKPMRRQVFPVFQEHVAAPVEHFLKPEERSRLESAVVSSQAAPDREYMGKKVGAYSDASLYEEARRLGCLPKDMPVLPSLAESLQRLAWVSRDTFKEQLPGDVLFRGTTHPLAYWNDSNRAGRSGLVYAGLGADYAVGYAATDGESPTRSFWNPLPKVDGSHVGFLHVFKNNGNEIYPNFGLEEDNRDLRGKSSYELETNITRNNELLGTYLVHNGRLALIPDTGEWRALLQAMMPRRGT